MRRSIVAASIVLATMLAVVVSGTLPRGFAQVAGPQGDEFNNDVFAAPFTAKCAQFAIAPCPDAQSANTWSLNGVSPGQLRIVTQPGDLRGTASQGSNNARNLILQPYNPLVDWTVTAKLTFPATNVAVNALGQTAGILIYQDDDNFLYVARTFVTVGGVAQSQIQFLQESAGADVSGSFTEQGVIPPTIYLRIVKTGTSYTAFYSTDNFVTSNVPVPAGAAPSATPTLTPTGTTTVTPGPTATGTSVPTAYTASYASPQVGVFAWGGTNSAVVSSQLPADFDWFRVGNSATPAPTALPTSTGTAATTSTATSTATATSTSTAAPTATSTAAPTATSTTAPTPTNTPVPTPTPKPSPPKHVAAFSWTSVWYRNIHTGNVEVVQVQAKSHTTQGIWTVVYFATGKQIHFYTNTDSKGFWQTNFRIPSGTISSHSPTAVVTFQLWFGSSTTKDWQTFNVIR